MNDLIVAPIVIPALAGALLVLLHASRLDHVRRVSAFATLLFVASAILLLADADGGTPRAYALGGWPAPFGIVLVLDRLSAWMVLLTAVLASGVFLYAVHGFDGRGRFFHALFQFQLMGLAGAFLTGDLFNLFVFFEVMLIASYCLMLQGLGAARLRATLRYVAINLTASGVFLVAISLLYGITGTLNMAHLSERLSGLAAEEAVLAAAAGVLLVGVFCVKAAVFPLYFWLPAGYSSAAAPVAALFAIMTKVGVYAIVRVTTIVYGGNNGFAHDMVVPWLLPLALLTLALGALGALGARRLATMISYLTVASVGTILTALCAGEAAGLSAALYYIAHSTIAIAILFLLTDSLGRQRGAVSDLLHVGPEVRQAAGLGIVFLMAAAAVAGIPPSAGFVGKLMVLQSARGASVMAAIWITILGTSFIMLIACVRAGTLLLWSTARTPPSGAVPRAGEWLAVAVLAAASFALVIFANPAKAYTDAAAAQLAERSGYVDAVLGPTRRDLLRPFSGIRAQ